MSRLAVSSVSNFMFLRCVVCGRRSQGWIVHATHAHAHSHGHNRRHHHDHVRPAPGDKRYIIAIALNLSFVVVEAAGRGSVTVIVCGAPDAKGTKTCSCAGGVYSACPCPKPASYLGAA
jgi:hypothetical protein